MLPFTSPLWALLGKAVTYLILAGAGAAGAATLYRFGPAGRRARWKWLTPGSLVATAGWLLLTLLFGVYVSKLGHYNATYGSLSAVIALLTWLYVSSYIFLLGAELNSEIEKWLTDRSPDGSPGRAEPPQGLRPPSSPADHAAGAHGEAGRRSA
jgi:membrane protein